jgi:hypothetical protein
VIGSNGALLAHAGAAVKLATRPRRPPQSGKRKRMARRNALMRAPFLQTVVSNQD